MSQPKPLHHRLWQALEAGDLARLNAALAEGANPDGRAGAWVPLGKALRRGHVDLALALLDAGARADGNDAHESLLALAAADDALLPVLRRMLEQGAQPSHEALVRAARGQAQAAIELLIARGAPALVEHPHRELTPLCWWSAQGKRPIPGPLMEAVFHHPMLAKAATDIAVHCARRHDMQILLRIGACPDFPDQARHDLLTAALQSGWGAGVDYLLDHRLVPTELPPHPGTHALMAAYDSTQHRRKVFGGDIVGRLLDYGFDIQQDGWCYTRSSTHPHQIRPTSTFLRLVERTAKPGRRKFLSSLLARGATLHCRRGSDTDRHAGGGLPHLLLELKDPSNALWVIGKDKDRAKAWERGADPGLACALLSRTVDQETPTWLRKLVAMGADLQRVDADGKTAWEVLLDQIDPRISKVFKVKPEPDDAHVRAVAEELARLGLVASSPAGPAGTARERMQSMGLDEAWISTLDAWTLHEGTVAAAGAATQARARL